jgi:transcriptional regulator with GAF, ATPase, and Fis domain
MKTHNITTLFELILEKVIRSMEVSYVGLVVTLDSSGNLNTVTWKSFNERVEKKLSFKLKETLLWEKAGGDISKTIILNDLDKILNNKLFNQINSIFDNKIRSGIYSPIIVEDRLYGVIAVYSKNTDVFDKIDLEIMDYVKLQLEIAINN